MTMGALAAFEDAKQKAHDYLSKLQHDGYCYGPIDKESYFIDGKRSGVDADGAPSSKTTWMFMIEKPGEGDTTIKFSTLPKDAKGKTLKYVEDCWERYEAAPEDLARRVIEEIRSLIEMSGGWTQEVMR